MDTRVEALHAEDAISGETFLFCVENSLHTLKEVADCLANGAVGCGPRVRSEVESILAQKTLLRQDEVKSEPPTFNPAYTHNIEGRNEAYLMLKEGCSVRTQNALNYLESQLKFPSEAFWAFLMDESNRRYNFKHIRNVGNKTVLELLTLVETLEEMPNLSSTINPSEEETSVVETRQYNDRQIELLGFAIETELSQLSVRSNNALLSLKQQCGGSWVELYRVINALDFDLLSLKNIGKRSLPELRAFIERLGVLCQEYLSADDYKPQANSIRAKSLQQSFGLTEKEVLSIVEEFPDFETPPLFKMIEVFMRRKHRDWMVISGSLNIFQEQEVVDRRIIADQIGLSQERVRQLRIKLYKKLISTIKRWIKAKNDFDFSHYLDFCQMAYNDGHIHALCETEKVHFNANFVYRVLSLFFSEGYVLIGDDAKAFSGQSKKGNELCIVPVDLSRRFKFDDFVSELSSKIDSKVYKDETLDLKEYLLRFFNGDIDFAKMHDLLEICGQIIHRVFDIIVVNNTVTIKANAIKPIPDILEEILSEKGAAMSLDEIYEQFKARNPDYSRDKDSLRGNIGRNSNIVPIGRTSSYVLKEWEKKGIKGGTIKDLVFDLLVERDSPLSIEEIAQHVLLFREGTNEKSVYSNMFADKVRRFSIYEYDGGRVYGLTQKSYDSRYVPLEEEALSGSKRGFDESLRLLEEFIKENNHFPFSSSDDQEEMRLHRFWSLHKSRRAKGLLDVEQISEINRIEKLYKHKELSKKDYLIRLGLYAEKPQIAAADEEYTRLRALCYEHGIDPDAL